MQEHLVELPESLEFSQQTVSKHPGIRLLNIRQRKQLGIKKKKQSEPCVNPNQEPKQWNPSERNGT